MENLLKFISDSIYRYKDLNIKSLKQLINKELITTDIKYISELKGQFFQNPLLSISLSICLFSMAGIPPLIGFFSKQFVLYSAIQGGYYFISIIAILVSVISASYYLKIIRILHEINITNKRKISEKTNINLFKNTYNSLSALKVF